MSTLIIGFFLLVGIVVSALEGSASTYLQYRPFAIVIGGTLSVLIFSTSPAVLKMLWQLLGTLFQDEKTIENFQGEIRQLAQNRNQELPTDTHPLLLYASELWTQGIDPDLFLVLLSQKRSDLVTRGVDAVYSLRNLSKYPPALGMTGTVMGIVNVFYSLDANKDSIGVNLATAMTATFLGLILANLLIAPLADRLTVRQVRQERLCDGLYEILLLINGGEPAVLIQGEMNERAA